MASVIRFVCHDCGGPVTEAKLFRTLPRVTSDCRPWPAGGRMGSCRSCGLIQTWASPQWRKECTRIYSTYKIYRQSGGKEQAVFGGGGSEPRSARIVRGLRSVHRLPVRGNLLDIGCGNGGFLRAFQKKYPKWRLYGTEFDRRNERVLKRIPGFAGLYCALEQPPNSFFDLISLVHVLEHLKNPSLFLAGLLKLARPGAKILIEVPDAKANPFILPVADHISHFDLLSLRTVAEKAGLRVKYLSNKLVPRELSLVARAQDAIRIRKKSGSALVKWHNRHLIKLSSFTCKAQQMANQSPIEIFGSSLGASWLFGVCRGRVKFFLDEDKNKIGREHLGTQIMKLSKIRKKIKNLFVPLKNLKLYKRLKNQGHNVINL